MTARATCVGIAVELGHRRQVVEVDAQGPQRFGTPPSVARALEPGPRPGPALGQPDGLGPTDGDLARAQPGEADRRGQPTTFGGTVVTSSLETEGLQGNHPGVAQPPERPAHVVDPTPIGARDEHVEPDPVVGLDHHRAAAAATAGQLQAVVVQRSRSTSSTRWVEPSTSAGAVTRRSHTVGASGSGQPSPWSSAAEPDHADHREVSGRSEVHGAGAHRRISSRSTATSARRSGLGARLRPGRDEPQCHESKAEDHRLGEIVVEVPLARTQVGLRTRDGDPADGQRSRTTDAGLEQAAQERLGAPFRPLARHQLRQGQRGADPAEASRLHVDQAVGPERAR